MSRNFCAACFVIALILIASCTSETSNDREGIRVEARQDVMLSDAPLGDVIVGNVEQSDEVTASCYVPHARSDAGVAGSAIRVTTGDLEAYAAVTDFPEDPHDRHPTFDLNDETLRDRLPGCSP